MAARIKRDEENRSVQVFAPKRIEAVVAATEWVPQPDDMAFAVSADCTYTIDDGVVEGTLAAGSIRGIFAKSTFTFSVSQNIEVM